MHLACQDGGLEKSPQKQSREDTRLLRNRMFAVMYRYLPDVRLAWADVFVGACMTALLFSIGKGALAIYLAHSNIASVYGAAGSLALILVWVYYSSMIFLFGAEFTRSWTREYHGPAKPERGAVHVTRTIETTTPAAPQPKL